jgi:hypothetical protein
VAVPCFIDQCVIVIDGGLGTVTVTEGGGGGRGASTTIVGRGSGTSTTTVRRSGSAATTTRGLVASGRAVLGPAPTVVVGAVSVGVSASPPQAVRVRSEASENIVSNRPTERMGTSVRKNVYESGMET